jgi:16S rRNA (uracil1498-N3)-methyltransferase
MQFLYDEGASNSRLKIVNENYKYLFRVRRKGVGETLFLRNLRDNILYKYEIVEVSKREAILELISSEVSVKNSAINFHLIWCLIDPKSIEKSLPYLNQIGVSKISFVYCDRSQKNFKVDIVRFQKIVINSSQQSGRTSLMEFEILDSIDEVTQKYNSFCVLDFGGLTSYSNECQRVLVGCEGGFSEGERESLASKQKISFKTDLILKSETAAIVIAAKYLI